MTYPTKAIEALETRTLMAHNPLVITHGGTYSGNWESEDRTVPAVLVKTSEPVVIENSVVRGRGDLIVSGVDHTNIVVRHTAGFGVNPGVYGKAPGRFFEAEVFDNVVLEDNFLENTGGIKLLNYAGDFSAGESVRIVRNQAHNIDGRKSDGNGGWLDFNKRTRLSNGTSEKGYEYAQFVQFDKVRHLGGIEIAYNSVVNDPGQSRVEDVISIYKSSGTAQSPIRIHDNYIDGAYTIKPWMSDTSDGVYEYDWGFSGGGIMLGDGVGSTAADDPAFVKAYSNTVVSTTNYGIALSAGHDLEAYGNRIVSAGVLDDGTPITQQNVGLYVWDSYHAGSSHFFNNVAHDNVVGWMNDGSRNDWWSPQSSTLVNNTHMAGPITLASETAERDRWQASTGEGTPPTTVATGTLAGTIFDDQNGDGIRDAEDEGATGFTMFLDLDGDGALGDNEPTARSSSTGRYRFDNLAPGTYTVRLLPADGWRASKGTFAVLAVDAGETSTRYFGVSTTTMVTGTVYMDADKDGGRDALEGGLPGWTVYADVNLNGQLDDGERTAVTNSNGRYALVGLAPGSYQIRVAQQSGYRRTSPGAGYRGVTLSAGEVIEARNFGQKRLKRAA